MTQAPTDTIVHKLRRLRGGEAARVVDLFAGCGGMSLGFKRAGCEIVAGIEMEPVRARTHARNFHPGPMEALHGKARDITVTDPIECLGELTGGLFPEVDIVVGGPPCQAYARVGRAKLREIGRHPRAHLQDPRGQLYAAYVAWVAALRPVAVVMENVPDILNYGGENVGEMVAGHLDDLGYEVRYTLLNAANFGVPQTRERWYLIGIHRAAGVIPSFPVPTNHVELPVGYKGTRSHAAAWSADCPDHAIPLPIASPDLPGPVTCFDALADLPFLGDEAKRTLKRGGRDLTARQPYLTPARNQYQRMLRKWPGLGVDAAGVTAHVIRALPRDYAIFRRMKEGDHYPAAHAAAMALLEERLAEEAATSGSRPRHGGRRWSAILAATVPPYNPATFPNRWRKLERHFPSRTLMAHLSHDSYSHIHYDSDQARTISVREAARLQSFPDGFQFCGAMNAAFGQIGNAVPPLMALRLAERLLSDVRAVAEAPRESVRAAASW